MGSQGHTENSLSSLHMQTQWILHVRITLTTGVPVHFGSKVPDQAQHPLPLLPFSNTHALATGSSGVIHTAGMLLVDQNYK